MGERWFENRRDFYDHVKKNDSKVWFRYPKPPFLSNLLALDVIAIM